MGLNLKVRVGDFVIVEAPDGNVEWAKVVGTELEGLVVNYPHGQHLAKREEVLTRDELKVLLEEWRKDLTRGATLLGQIRRSFNRIAAWWLVLSGRDK